MIVAITLCVILALVILAQDISALVNLLVTVLTTIFFLIVGPKIIESASQLDEKLSRAPLLEKLQFLLHKSRFLFVHFELSLLIFILLIVTAYTHESLFVAMSDMEIKGYISFTQREEGLNHLKFYFGGYIFLPGALLTLGFYGFYTGFHGYRVYFWRLLLAIAFGVLLAVSVLSIIRGEWTGVENLSLATSANNLELPIGSPPAILTIVLASLLILCVFIGLYISFFTYLGTKVLVYLQRRKFSDLKLDINNANKVQIRDALDIKEELAEKIMELKQTERLTAKTIQEIKGIGGKTVEKGRRFLEIDDE